MRIKGEIIEAKYAKGVSASTGNSYEMTEYIMESIDEQGHHHKLMFSLFNEQMYQAAVHKGDKVEVSIQLGLREYNGRKFNNVQNVYFVQKLNPDGTNTKEQVMAQQAQKQEQRQAQSAPADKGDDLPF